MKQKTANFLLILFCLMLCSNTSIFSQDNPILDQFSAFTNNNKVYLDWVIKSGNTCNGLNVLRSVDSINFNIVKHIEGVCGNLQSPQPYSFVDESPIKNVINYYKLELGGKGFSKVLGVEIIDYGTDNYQLRPNPANDHCRLYFNNPGKDMLKISLYNLLGNEIRTQETQEEYLDINTSELIPSVYIFTISKESNVVSTSGKMIIQH